MKKKGFTLLELLAAIVVLACIVIIAIPIILNLIEDSRKQAAVRGAENYLDSVEKFIAIENLNGEKIISGKFYTGTKGNLYKDETLTNTYLTVKIKGKLPSDGGQVEFQNGKIKECYLIIDGYPIVCTNNGLKAGKKGQIPVQKLIVQNDSITVNKGEDITLPITIVPQSASDKTLSYKSDNNDVISVKDGKLISKKGGIANITITTSNNISKTIKITVEEKYEPGDIVEVDTLYELGQSEFTENGIYKVKLSNQEEISFELYIMKEDVNYTSSPTLCNSTPDTLMCVVKYEKSLTISSGVTLTPKVRKKGFVIFADSIVNNGTISMTARGAHAEGQNLLLYKNKDGKYEEVSKDGGAAGISTAAYQVVHGKPGDPSKRQTGGGAAGYAAYHSSTSGTVRAGNGSAGTSYSGGSGGGGLVAYSFYDGNKGGDAGINGGAGGTGKAIGTGSKPWHGGGAGNPAGGVNPVSTKNNAQSGTGGLLIIYTNDFKNQGTLSAVGSKGANFTINPAYYFGFGGCSGGGSINIFSKNTLTLGTTNVKGGEHGYGNGGAGSVSSCLIQTGTCVK